MVNYMCFIIKYEPNVKNLARVYTNTVRINRRHYHCRHGNDDRGNAYVSDYMLLHMAMFHRVSVSGSTVSSIYFRCYY